MNQGIIVGILSILFYLTNLLGGGQGQPIKHVDPPMSQQSYAVLGQSGTIIADRVTLRRSPSGDAQALGTAIKGAPIIILDKKDNWYKIRPRSGVEGWIPDYALAVQETVPSQPDQVVLGFYPGGELAYDSLLANGTKLTGLSPLGWQLDRYGKLDASFDPEEVGRSLYFAGNREMDTYAHVRIAANPSRLLEADYLREDTINRLLSVVDEWGLKGVVLDLAYVPGSEQAELFRFLEATSAKLRQEEKTTMVALPWDATIDYETAANAVDYLILKTAAEPVHGQVGPRASAPEVEAMVQEIVGRVTPDKIILSISTGGVHWSRTGIPQSFSHQDVLELAAKQGASVKWDTDSKTPYFIYNGGEVWFENRYSLKYKIDLAEDFNLGGLALQNLGQEDAEIWTRL